MKSLLVIRSSPYDSWNDKISALTYAADARHIQLHVIDRQVCAHEMQKLIDYWKPDGVLVAELKSGTPPYDSSVFNNVPAVFMDCAPDAVTAGYPLVLHDCAAICTQAIAEFLNIGCREIGYVGWYEKAFWSDSKLIACRETLAAAGKQLHEFTPTQRETDNLDLLNSRLSDWLEHIPRPCGILATNDLIGEQIIYAVHRLGLDIPSDIAIIGVDNDKIINERTKPSLSSFALDFNGAAEAVLSALQTPVEKRPSGIIWIPPRTFIRRQSSRVLRRKDSEVEAAVEKIRREACAGLKPSDVLDVFSCSRRTAETRFKTAVGHAIGDEILSVRFTRLLELLANPRIQISALADLCGFPSSLVLRRQFRARYGMTPGEWRERKSGNKQ